MCNTIISTLYLNSLDSVLSYILICRNLRARWWHTSVGLVTRHAHVRVDGGCHQRPCLSTVFYRAFLIFPRASFPARARARDCHSRFPRHSRLRDKKERGVSLFLYNAPGPDGDAAVSSSWLTWSSQLLESESPRVMAGGRQCGAVVDRCRWCTWLETFARGHDNYACPTPRESCRACIFVQEGRK